MKLVVMCILRKVIHGGRRSFLSEYIALGLRRVRSGAVMSLSVPMRRLSSQSGS